MKVDKPKEETLSLLHCFPCVYPSALILKLSTGGKPKTLTSGYTVLVVFHIGFLLILVSHMICPCSCFVDHQIKDPTSPGSLSDHHRPTP